VVRRAGAVAGVPGGPVRSWRRVGDSLRSSNRGRHLRPPARPLRRFRRCGWPGCPGAPPSGRPGVPRSGRRRDARAQGDVGAVSRCADRHGAEPEDVETRREPPGPVQRVQELPGEEVSTAEGPHLLYVVRAQGHPLRRAVGGRLPGWWTHPPVHRVRSRGKALVTHAYPFRCRDTDGGNADVTSCRPLLDDRKDTRSFQLCPSHQGHRRASSGGVERTAGPGRAGHAAPCLRVGRRSPGRSPPNRKVDDEPPPTQPHWALRDPRM